MTKAWGDQRHSYYETGYVDPDWGSDEEANKEAEEEETEALRLQAEHLAALTQDDFMLSNPANDDDEKVCP